MCVCVIAINLQIFLQQSDSANDQLILHTKKQFAICNTNIWRTVATKIAMLFTVINLTQFFQLCASLVCVICDILNILVILKTAEIVTATLPK